MSTPTSNSVGFSKVSIPSAGVGTPVIDGSKWGTGPAGSGVALTYSFPDANAVFAASHPENGSTITPLSAQQQANVAQVLQNFSNVANITFTPVADTATTVGELRFSMSSDVPLAGTGVVGYAYFPSSGNPQTGDAFLSPLYYAANNADPGTLQYMVMAHETGHAIGLKHPFDTGGSGVNNLGLSAAENYFGNTIMSYTAKAGGSSTIQPDRFPTTPMLHDIAALQYLYGANASFNSGDTVYAYDSADKYWEAIWDGSGNDTIVVAGSGDTKINLNDGQFSQIGQPITFTKGTPELRTVAIAKNAIIENATTGTGNDVLTGNGFVNILDGGAGDDTLDGGAGIDTLIGGAGNDTFVIDSGSDVVTELAGGGTDIVKTGLSGFTLSGEIENLTYTGKGNFAGTGSASDNVIVSGAGTDTLSGGAGNDTLNGGTGADTLVGGTGNDTFFFDNSGDVISEAAGEGTDEVRTTFSVVSLSSFGEIENLTYVGTGNFTGTGTAGNNVITGNFGNDTLNGGTGADTLIGGAGNDTFIVENAGDTVTEAAVKGIDLVKVSLSAYALTDNVENLTFTGSGDFVGIGNELGNAMTGGAGNDLLDGDDGADTLDGGAGADSLTGGAGNDVFVVDNAGDIVTEAASGGTDMVRTTVATYALTAEVENLTYTGSGNFSGTGNGLNNTILSGKGNDTLDGGAGSDKLTGGAGNDIYVVDHAQDTISEVATGGGTDEIQTSLATFYKLANTIENLSYVGTGGFAAIGNSLVNVITGGAGNDTLDGGAGADTLVGGAGNDIYVVDGANDKVTELAGGGIDEIRSKSGTFSIATLTEIENLTAAGTGNFIGTGNALANTITGKSGNDTLDGGAGADTLIGGIGSDVYIVDDAGDTVTELAGQGTDTVRTGLSVYALDDNIENLTYTGATAFIGLGNGLNNSITGAAGADTLDGDAGNDTLDGGAGADDLTGGAGNDVFIVDNAGDVATEAAGGGIDEVRTSLATFSLAGLAEIENLTYTGSAGFNGTGNAQVNVLKSGSGADTLNGGAGADTMIGGLGNDLYIVDSSGDVVTEASKQGTDTVQTTLSSHTLALNVENLTFTGTGDFAGTGNALANSITGGTGNDTLDGGGGADTLIGGGGDDVYVVDNSNDVVTEGAAAGSDTVRVSLALYTLGANLENLTYIGAGIFKGTGNALVNVITGGAKADTLNGGAGADTLVGGAGNDVYLVDDVNDVVTEAAGGGTDEVRSSAGVYLLGSETENLVFTGTGSFVGFGNDLGNAITGGTAADTLDGGAGADTLDGGTGADTLTGGAGNDVFVMDNAGDSVIELASGGTDTIRTTLASVTLAGLPEIENLTYTGKGSFIGTGNASGNILTGSSGSDTLTGGGGNDTLIGGAGNDTYTVEDAGDVVTEGISAGTDTILTKLSSFTLSLNVEILTFQGTGDFTATGNVLNNTITGGSGDDILDGRQGSDRLVGGAGDDIYFVDNSADTVIEAIGEGIDEVRSTSSLHTLAANVENLTYTGKGGFKGTGNALDNIIVGGDNSDTLTGAAGADTLAGGAGTDLLIGGAGSDIFVFETGDGADRVNDFTIGTDLIDLSAVATVTNFVDVQAAASQNGADTVLAFGNGDTVTLVGITATGLTAGDFLF